MRAVITFDIHLNDRPGDIVTCLDRLEAAGWRATFFVPTSMLGLPEFSGPLRELENRGCELGTHAHHHNGPEKAALRGDGDAGLGFLARSADAFAQFFGRAPRVFRAPCWAYLCEPAVDELERLGYRVDSSRTPQRPGILSSFPYDNRHMVSGRAPHFLRPGLLEVPTSTMLVPLGWPTFCTLRRRGSMVVTRALALEAKLRRSLVLVGQFHVSDLAPGGDNMTQRTFRWSDLIPRADGGIAARRWLRMTDRGRVAGISLAVMTRMASGELVSFAEVLAAMAPERSTGRAGEVDAREDRGAMHSPARLSA